MIFTGDQPFQVFSNGEDLILISGNQIYVAENTYMKRFDISANYDTLDISTWGDRRLLSIPIRVYTDINLSLVSMRLECFPPGKIDIDKLLFKNKTILEVLKITKNKIKEREGEENDKNQHEQGSKKGLGI